VRYEIKQQATGGTILMRSLKTFVIAAAFSLGIVGAAQVTTFAQVADTAAQAAAVSANPDSTAVNAVTTPSADAAINNEAAPAGDANYVPLKPVAGVGQPVDGGISFQTQVTPVGKTAIWFHDVILLPIAVATSLLVLGLLLWVVARYRRARNPVASKTSHNTLIEVLWTGIPVLILAIVAVPSIRLLAQQYEPASEDALTIKVTGYQWYWGYEYPDEGIGEYVSRMLNREQADAAGEPHQLAVDNRMVVPVGREVKLIVTAADVIHSFAVPSFWTKMDAVPGRANEVTFTPEQVGVFYGQCSELCGVDHGYMPIAVEVLPVDRWEAWVRSKGGNPAGKTAEGVAAPAVAVPAALPAGDTTEAAAASAAAPAALN
jgi:cytochrome c oxidase subunit 2